LTVRVVPCLDVRAGRVVKGVRFQGLRDCGDPAGLAAAYDGQGADELVLLDVSATTEERWTAADAVAAVRARLRIPLTVGGGVRSLDDASRLLDAGADKVSLNTAAIEDPELVACLAGRFGAQCVVVALDARRGESRWEAVVRSGTEPTGLDVVQTARRLAELGAGEVLLTSWDRDGTGLGYDLDLLEAVCAAVPVPVVASGGASSPEHMAAAATAGATGLLAASIFHDGTWTVGALKARLRALGVEVRA
jgi:imidazole glycerol-phosphate synthase subunit HisF